MSIAHLSARAAFVAAAAMLAGCAPTGDNPTPINGERSVNRLRDWDASVARVARSMELAGVIPALPGPPPPGTPPDMPAPILLTPGFPGPFYVHVMAQGSTFLEAVRLGMERELLRRGVEIARSPQQATVINLDLDVIRWAAGPVLPTYAEAAWRASIVAKDRELMRTGDSFSIAANDLALYEATTTLAAIASPGVSLLGAARPLRYAR